MCYAWLLASPVFSDLRSQFTNLRCVGAETLISGDYIGLHSAGVLARGGGCVAKPVLQAGSPEGSRAPVVRQRIPRQEKQGADLCATFCWRALPTFCCNAVKRASRVIAPCPPSA